MWSPLYIAPTLSLEDRPLCMWMTEMVQSFVVAGYLMPWFLALQDIYHALQALFLGVVDEAVRSSGLGGSLFDIVFPLTMFCSFILSI